MFAKRDEFVKKGNLGKKTNIAEKEILLKGNFCIFFFAKRFFLQKREIFLVKIIICTHI